VERYAAAVDIDARWAEYKITPYIKTGDNFDFPTFKDRVEQILAQNEILMTKTGKQKGRKVEKTFDAKRSIGTHYFKGNDFYIILKVGQGGEIPALRADDFMKFVDKNRIFDITRLRFYDEKLNEM